MTAADPTLAEWQQQNLPQLRRLAFRPSAVRNVSVLSYYFRNGDEFDRSFWRTEFAFLKTFETQGVMPSVLVVNLETPEVASFCEKYGIELQVEKSLIPGQIKTLALDSISNLYARFKTDYVLTIQDDGFPLHPGLEEFIGRYDYIGAPWVHHNTYYDLYPYKYCVGNGGFSLRSRRICEAANRYYSLYFRKLPYWWYILGDDTFYCKTLRFWFPSFRRQFSWAPREVASRFSLECNSDFLPQGAVPLGFHGKAGWQKVCQMGCLDISKGLE